METPEQIKQEIARLTALKSAAQEKVITIAERKTEAENQVRIYDDMLDSYQRLLAAHDELMEKINSTEAA